MPEYQVQIDLEGGGIVEADSIEEAMEQAKDDFRAFETRRRIWVDEKNVIGHKRNSRYFESPEQK